MNKPSPTTTPPAAYPLDVKAVERQAWEELRAEHYRDAVEKAKARIRRGRWYHRLFPWRISLIITKRS